MTLQQINLKLPLNLLHAAQSYIEHFGYRNLQELAAESIREKVFKNNEFDESFTKEEIELIDNLITLSVKKREIVSEEELNKILLE